MDHCIGIIIPCYNVEQFLESCLQSVVAQSYSNLSIIIIDDGSTDSSFAIAWKYFLQDARITIIQKPNGGISSARNVGLDFLCGELEFCNTEYDSEYYKIQSFYTYRGCFKEAKQEHEIIPLCKEKHEVIIYTHQNSLPTCNYIHFLDSDDLLTNDCIMQCMQALCESGGDCEIVWHDFYKISEEGKTLSKQEQFQNYSFPAVPHVISQKEALRIKLSTSNAFTWHGLIALHTIKQYRLRFMDSINYAEDQCFAFLLFACLKKICLIPNALLAYRVRAGSLTTFNPNTYKYPLFKADIYEAFANKELAFMYDKSNSWLIIANAFCDFMQSYSLSKDIQEVQQHIVCYLVPKSIKSLQALAVDGKDVKNSKQLFNDVLPYLPSNHVRFSSKVAYYCPILYKIFYYLQQFSKRQK